VTTIGLVIMTASISSIVALTSFCLYRVLRLPPVEVGKLDIAPLNIETPDTRQR
jgi:hypothetical protein